MIKKLPKNLIEQIAAGEVIDRPTSIFKELLDNSLDAKSSKITIELTDGGLKKIRVFDDGIGMSKKDLLESFKKHTTSKITSLQDLTKIHTLGFRGEALNSIGHVSKMTIRSKPKTELVGYEIIIKEGKLENQNPVGMPNGTEIIVEEIFNKIPARKKNYIDPQDELKQILNIFIQQALVNTDVSLKLVNNKKTVLHFFKNENVKSRLSQILGKDIADNLIEIRKDDPRSAVYGFISLPKVSQKNSNYQYFFVNGRPFNSKNLSKLFKEAYASLIQPKDYPVVVSFLKVPSDLIDINVHPRKEEIRFFNHNEIQKTIYEAIIDSFDKNDLSYGNQNLNKDEFETFLYQTGFDSNTADIVKENENVWNYKAELTEKEILQVHKLYLIHETPKGIEIIDQHAAHERILYEEFLLELEKKKKETIKLKRSLKLNLPVDKVTTFKKVIDPLKKLGFLFNSRNEITHIPKIYKNRNINLILLELLGSLEKSYLNNNEATKDSNSLRTISYLACKSAIKAGDYLTLDERKNLLTKLSKTKTKYTCPHGRPVSLLVTNKDLIKMFKR